MKLMNKIMLSCKKATELIEIKQDMKLGFLESLQLKLHLLVCKTCSCYEKHSNTINDALHKHLHKNSSIEKLVNNELKEKIKSKL